MEEIWKDIEGYEGLYAVSNMGRVRSLDRVCVKPHSHTKAPTEYRYKGRIMKIIHNRTITYPYICLHAGGIAKFFPVHSLVAISFVHGYFPGASIIHKNGDMYDNRAENLEWRLKGDDSPCAEEVWKDIEGYEGVYAVSNLGRVRSYDRVIIKPNPRNGVLCEYLHKGRIMKPSAYPNGYLTVCLKLNGQKENCLVHRLVGKAFVPGYFEGADINHKNENVADNRAVNIEWCSRTYNLQYNGRAKRVGIVQGKDVEQWTLDGKLVATYDAIRHAAAATGINRTAIGYCCNSRRGAKTAGGYRWRFADE